MNFAYSFSGSLGVALLVKSERDLLAGNLDSSIETLYQIFDISDVDEVRDVANSLGRAVIKRVHDWCTSNVEAGFSADICWKRSDGRELGHMIDKRKLEKVVHHIQATSDESTSPVREIGMLVGGDISSGSFHFVVQDGPSYSGHLADDASLDEMTLGKFYEAEIEVTEVYYFATEQRRRTNVLRKLHPID